MGSQGGQRLLAVELPRENLEEELRGEVLPARLEAKVADFNHMFICWLKIQKESPISPKKLKKHKITVVVKRPPTLLAKEQIKEIKKNLKKYSVKFNQKDAQR